MRRGDRDRRRALAAALALNTAVALLALYGFERAFSPYRRLPADGVVEGVLHTWGHVVRSNSLGFREREIVPKPRGVLRVMVLGDSLTWGPGLAEEERYTAVAEKLLNEAFAPRRFEVLNFGVSGSPTLQQAVLLRRLRAFVEPDLVVVGFCLNDPQPRSQEFSVEREALKARPAVRLLRAAFGAMRGAGLPYVARLLDEAFFRAAERLGVIPDWPTALDRAYEPASEEWALFTRALRSIRASCDEAGLPPPIFAVLNQGAYPDRPADYARPDAALARFLRWYRSAEEAARAAGFETYDHEQEIAAGLAGEPLGVNRVDMHPSARLNRVYGEKLYEAVARRLAPGAP